ncbi:MAG: hypothetical protein ABI151_07355, partial [Chitinophagaceae bacterium]
MRIRIFAALILQIAMCLPATHVSKFLLPLICLCVCQMVLAQYQLKILPADTTSESRLDKISLSSSFKSRSSSDAYISSLPDLLQIKGYPTASIDSIRYDSMQTVIYLYLGKRYSLASIST